jgi:ethanolamine utilization protein EutA
MRRQHSRTDFTGPTGPPRYDRLQAFASGLRDGLSDRVAGRRPVYLMLDGDVAMTLGRLLTEELGVTGPLLVIDGLILRDFEYIDIGRIRYPSRTVPVTIKSLLFENDPRDTRVDRPPPTRVRRSHPCQV